MSRARILIVDDSENLRSVLQLNFEYLGYDVLLARDGEEGYELINSERPDIVVLDVIMPRQNGFQVCRKLKSNPHLASIPVIFLTAKRHKEDRHWGRDCGADAYLTKPFGSAELERVIERLLETRSRTRDSRGFDEEIAARRKRGEPFWILTVKFDPKSLHVFRQKYGELRFREALDGIGETVEVIVRKSGIERLVWTAGEETLRAILPGNKESVQSLRDRLNMQGDLFLRSFYDDEDTNRGYVVTRNQDGDEVHVPLMTIESILATGNVQEAV